MSTQVRMSKCEPEYTIPGQSIRVLLSPGDKTESKGPPQHRLLYSSTSWRPVRPFANELGVCVVSAQIAPGIFMKGKMWATRLHTGAEPYPPLQHVSTDRQKGMGGRRERFRGGGLWG
ncbi:hypothetical protein BaRGS_00017522 [Batillaria attramentaria]|uniref:Uncharacterized protein n=1 Tax=Batillaria attramentaria TaxID=370345 RepID=A0ABD0KW02_9CAEN